MKHETHRVFVNTSTLACFDPIKTLLCSLKNTFQGDRTVTSAKSHAKSLVIHLKRLPEYFFLSWSQFLVCTSTWKLEHFQTIVYQLHPSHEHPAGRSTFSYMFTIPKWWRVSTRLHVLNGKPNVRRFSGNWLVHSSVIVNNIHVWPVSFERSNSERTERWLLTSMTVLRHVQNTYAHKRTMKFADVLDHL